MPAKGGGNKSPKRSVSRQRSTSRGRPRKQSASPEAKSADRAASRGRGRPKTNTSPRPTRTPSAGRGRPRRVADDTPRGGANVHENSTSESRMRSAVTEVRTESTTMSTSSKKASARCSSCFSGLCDTFKLDFFGPLGSGALMLGLPPFVLAANALCFFSSPNSSKGADCSMQHLCTASNDSRLCDTVITAVRDWSALGFLLGWLLLQAALYLLPIGRVVDGYDPRQRLRYRVNLPQASVITAALVAFAVGYLHVDVFGFVVTHLFGIMWWSTVLAFVGGLALFYNGRKERTNDYGNTGWPTHDFFMGRTRNPRFRGIKWLSLFDLKMFFELRPGMLLWALISMSYFAVHFREVRAQDATTPWYGVPDGLNWNLTLLVLFHLWFVYDSMFNEFKILSTFDIVTEGFGWMLLYGDAVFLPFLYSINARYLLAAKSGLSATAQSPLYLGVLVLMHTVGYLVYRLSNNAKHAFRSNPNASAQRSLTVAGGRKVLVDGFWGLSRHPNYIGDLLMSWSWALLCGCPANAAAFVAIYFYPVFVNVLLLTRAVRDDAVRREKYGEVGWKRYCELVKWRVVPYIF